MIEKEIDILTTDGAMNTFITHPEEEGPHPVILFLMDAPGKRGELHDMARRLGTAGYYVMLPNLYYRRVRKYRIAESSREEMHEHMDSLSNAMACADVNALIKFSDSDDAARGGKIGCVGYCMSGPFAFAAAAAISRSHRCQRLNAWGTTHDRCTGLTTSGCAQDKGRNVFWLRGN
jgi:carboxymethylenebutenolidase